MLAHPTTCAWRASCISPPPRSTATACGPSAETSARASIAPAARPTAADRGRPSRRGRVELRVTAGTSDVDLRVAMHAGFTGIVTRAGRPVTKFRLMRGGTRTTIGSTVRDPRGRFFVACGCAAALTFAAQSPDGSSPPTAFATADAQIVQGIVLRVSERAVITGTIRHDRARPVRAAKVIARDPRTGAILAIRQVRPDANGAMSFRLSDLPTGRVRLDVDSYDFLPWTDDAVHVVEGQTTHRTVVVRDGGTLQVLARRPDESALAHAPVCLTHVDTGRAMRVGSFVSPDGTRVGARGFRTDDAGAFRRSGLAPGTYEITVGAGPHAATERATIDLGRVATIRIAAR